MNELKKISFAFALAVALPACESRPTTATQNDMDANEGDTAVVSRRNPEVAQELREFRNWVNRKTNRADSAAQENWPEVKGEFKERANRIETKLDSLSAESKEEYARLKAEYRTWEAQKERRESTPLDPNKLRQWEQQLLGTAKPLETLTAADMRETYLLFMGIVRAKKNRWDQNDWDYVDNVYSRLNDRKQQVENGLSSGDRIKIKALQAEYLTLEGAHDARDLVQSVRK